MKRRWGSLSVLVRRAWTVAALSTLTSIFSVLAESRHLAFFGGFTAVIVAAAWLTTKFDDPATVRPWMRWASYGLLIVSIVISVLAVARFQ